MSRRILIIKIFVVTSILLMLTCASCITTFYISDGAFPSCECRLRILNKYGDPIKGALLNIYQDKTLAFAYPFENYCSENSLVSDDNGEIILTHISKGAEFGGFGWCLFWIIPFNFDDEYPEYICQIDAEGYKTYRFSSHEIFNMAYEAEFVLAHEADDSENFPTKTIKLNGYDIKIPILEKEIILEKKRTF